MRSVDPIRSVVRVDRAAPHVPFDTLVAPRFPVLPEILPPHRELTRIVAVLAAGQPRARARRYPLIDVAALLVQTLRDITVHLVQTDALRVTRIPIADGDRLVFLRRAVDRDRVRRADLVHSCVALADRLLGVVLAG